MWVEKRERKQRTLVHHVTKQVGSHTGARSAQHLSKNPRERLENHYYCFTQFLPKDLGTHVPPPWGRAWGKSEFLWTAWPGLGKGFPLWELAGYDSQSAFHHIQSNRLRLLFVASSGFLSNFLPSYFHGAHTFLSQYLCLLLFSHPVMSDSL